MVLRAQIWIATHNRSTWKINGARKAFSNRRTAAGVDMRCGSRRSLRRWRAATML